MLSFDSGTYDIWPDFRLALGSPIDILPQYHYYLAGNNGSGKSSFIKKILLPELLSQNNIYRLYWEQQILLQGYALKAHAAFNKHAKRLDSELDCLYYLLNNLKSSLQREPRDAYFVVDECLYFQHIISFIKEHDLSVCLIFSHHDGYQDMDKVRTITFSASGPGLGLVHEHHQ